VRIRGAARRRSELSIAGLVNFIVRAAQARGVIPGRPPQYGPRTTPSPRDERGLSEIAELTLLVGAGLTVAAIILILT
jgi:hypothetical protein